MNAYQNDPTHNSWKGMFLRCYLKEFKQYHDYGGKGIRVCDRWLSFQSFVEDMGWRPEGKTIDRKDSKGNYCPSNCRWATIIEQARNKNSTGVLRLWQGEKRSINEIANIEGVGRDTLVSAIDRGLSLKKAVEYSKNPTPDFGQKYIKFDGREMSITDWAKELGIQRGTLSKRLARMPIEKALKMPQRKITGRNQT